MAAMLQVRDLSIRFGGLQALDGAWFDAHEGKITAVIGPNGAGKTTAINCVSGVYRPQSGSVTFNGASLLGTPPHKMARMGITRTFQNIQVFGRMTVLENVMVGMHGVTRKEFLPAMLRLPGLRNEEARIRERAWETLEFFGLENSARKPARELPYGDQKKVELARSLVSAPRMILLDEPVAGLNMAETESVGALIQKMRDRGIGLVLVEHDMGLVMKVSDMVVVMSEGRVLAANTPQAVQQNPEVIRTYLGGGEEFGLSA